MNVPTKNGHLVQIFTLAPGLVNLTSGTHDGVRAIHCVTDGTIDIAYPDGSTETGVPIVEGDEFGFEQAVSVTINSGCAVHLMG